METKEVDPNPSRSKPGFIGQQEIYVAQHKELCGEQPAPDVQENPVLNGIIATIPSEESMSDSPPSQADKVNKEIDSSKGKGGNELSCATCDQGFVSDASFRFHLENVYPCNQSGSLSMPKEDKVESRTCFKCGKLFASWQGLRGHLNRVTPCDHNATVNRRISASKMCHKCGRTFSSPQSLRIHLNKVKPCDQDITTPTSPPAPSAAIPPSARQVMNSDELKKEERKAKARYHARKAYLKKRGRLNELGDPPSSCSQSDDGYREMEETAPIDELNRPTSDGSVREGDKLKLLPFESKKLRLSEKVAQEEDEVGEYPIVISKLIAQPILPTSPSKGPLEKPVTSEGSFVYHPNHGHGGDLLAGGCSCPPCVRRWARNMMNRMQQLEDEVVKLRQKKLPEGERNNTIASADAASSSILMSQSLFGNSNVNQHSWPGENNIGVLATGKSIARGHLYASSVDIFKSLTSCSSVELALQLPEAGLVGGGGNNHPPSHTNDGSIFHDDDTRTDIPQFDDQQQQQPSPTAPALRGLGTDKRSLVDAYTHSNNQILIKEKMLKESKAQGCLGDKQKLCRQVDELRLFVSAEKSRREITVAALIAYEWKPRRDELKVLLEDNASPNAPRDEQVHHTKWSKISKKVSAKDKAIAELERQMDFLVSGGEDNRSRYAEMGELSSKMAAEYAAKLALEGECEEVFMGLVRSSVRIRWLVRNALL